MIENLNSCQRQKLITYISSISCVLRNLGGRWASVYLLILFDAKLVYHADGLADVVHAVRVRGVLIF